MKWAQLNHKFLKNKLEQIGDSKIKGINYLYMNICSILGARGAQQLRYCICSSTGSTFWKSLKEKISSNTYQKGVEGFRKQNDELTWSG